jgi:dTDP-4-amino-4,6-dideoxygalactose transaminase
MQFIDLAAQQKRIRKLIEANIQTVLDHGKYIMGPEIAALEKSLAEYVGTKHALACSSGTDALLLALMAKGVGPGDAVFTTPFTFIATGEVIAMLGAVPVFVDIDPDTFNLDPNLLSAAIEALQLGAPSKHPLPEAALQNKLNPKAVIAVDLFGLPADYEAIEKIAFHHNLALIEDAAQSFGAEYKGKKACALAEIGCTSFFPAKPLGCYGDGGMCFTDDDGIQNVMASIRIHGKGTDKYDNVRVGMNGRMDTLQAAILQAKFEVFPEEVELRQQVAARYNELLQDSGVKIPTVPEGYKSVWAQYSLLARDAAHRTALQNKLKEQGIPTAIYYPKPLHLQTAFQHLNYKQGDFPISEDYSTRVFSIPMHPYLDSDDQKRIASMITSST